MTTTPRSKTLSTVRYLTGAGHPKHLPHPQHREVMFIGRSNAGKSSVINTLLNQKIARTSRTPGRTQQIHFFQVHSGDCLVDCPGYGFAQVSRSVKAQWPALIQAYLKRPNLVGIIWIMDIRHPLQPADLKVQAEIMPAPCPVHILLNKADKLKAQAKNKAIQQVESAMQQSGHADAISIQMFSASKKVGVSTCRAQICNWLDQPATS
jgi:GTP-binding protein